MNNKLNNHELDMQATVFEATGSPTLAAVFREALAYREAESEPVAWRRLSYENYRYCSNPEIVRKARESGVDYVPVYASPVLSQPEPNNSKPVAEIVSKHGDPEAFGERELQVIADIRKMPYGTKLYASPVLGQTQNNDDKKDAERWRFIRKFLAVEDIDGSLDGETMHVLCIKESAFESSMIGFPRDVSIEVAIDAAIAKATGESE